jgi:hypothetical protein
MTLDAFGVERGDVAKKAPESHLDVNSLNTPEGLDRGIAMTDAVRRYHQKKARHGAALSAVGGSAAVAGGLTLHRVPRTATAALVGGSAVGLAGLVHEAHHADRANIAAHNERVLLGVKQHRQYVEGLAAGATPPGVAKGLLTHPEENTRAQNVASGTATGTIGGALVGHYMDRKGLGLHQKYVREGDPVKGFGRTTKAVARVSPKLAAKGVLLGDKLAFHGKTPAVFGAGFGTLGAVGGAMSQHRKKDIAKYTLPGDNPQAEAARERKKSGLGLAGVGYLVASRHKDVTPGAVDLITPAAKKGADATKVAEREAKIVRRTKAINTLSSRGGAAAVGLGLGMAGEGLASDWRHRKVVQRAKGKVEDHMQAYRENRDKRENSLTKSAFGVEDPRISKSFDSERQRHRRHELYEGGAAGGTVVAGAGAGVLGRQAVLARQSENTHMGRAKTGHTALLDDLHTDAQPKPNVTPAQLQQRFARAARLHVAQGTHVERALDAGKKARGFGAAAGGAGLGAAVLAGTAYGIHRHDTTGHGRGY